MDIDALYQEIENHFTHYQNSLKNYNESDFQTKKAEDIWSLAQMYEHLFTSSLFFLKLIKLCTNETPPAKKEGEKTDLGVKAFEYNSFPPIKIKVPEKWRGLVPEGKEISFYKENFSSLLAKIKEYSTRVKAYQGDFKMSHAAWGMLTAAEWYQTLEMHLRHHKRQQGELENFIAEQNAV